MGNFNQAIKWPDGVSSEVGIQNNTGCRIKSGITKLVYLIAALIATPAKILPKSQEVLNCLEHRIYIRWFPVPICFGLFQIFFYAIVLSPPFHLIIEID